MNNSKNRLFLAEKNDAVSRSNMLGSAILLAFVILTVVVFAVSVARAENYRGFQIGTYPVPTSQIKLTIKQAYDEYGANLIRYQIVDPTLDEFVTIPDYYIWWDAKIIELIEVLKFIRDNDLPVKIIVDMHSSPGDVLQKKWGSQHFVLTKAGVPVWINIWKDTIQKLNASGLTDYIIAWEPVNEPAAKSTKGLWAKYRKWLRAIRPLTDKPVIVSAKRRDDMWFKNAKPFPKKYGEIWYTTHFYKPTPISFYKINPSYDEERYQKEIRKFRRYPFRAVKQQLKHLKWFTAENNLVAFIGEFGISKYVPEKDRALVFRKTLKKFNDWGFYWAIHALNEHPVWQPSSYSINVIKNKIGE